jgi:hypothetical protein
MTSAGAVADSLSHTPAPPRQGQPIRISHAGKHLPGGASLARSKGVQMKSEGAAKTRHYAGPIKVMNVREVSAYLRVHPSHGFQCE